MPANERTDERVAQYLRLDFWLLQTTVQRLEGERRLLRRHRPSAWKDHLEVGHSASNAAAAAAVVAPAVADAYMAPYMATHSQYLHPKEEEQEEEMEQEEQKEQ